MVWEDLTELDHRRRDLWITWRRYSCTVPPRCGWVPRDAAYMVPVAAWEYMVARVRREYPETFFLLEGLGGRIEATVGLMHDANLNGAYSELFQNHDRAGGRAVPGWRRAWRGKTVDGAFRGNARQSPAGRAFGRLRADAHRAGGDLLGQWRLRLANGRNGWRRSD